MSEGFTVWFTGLSGAGKTTLANALQRELANRGRRSEIIDGDVVRQFVNGVGFSKQARDQHVRYIGYAAHLLSSSGVVAIVAVIAPYRDVRAQIRARHEAPFVEVFVDCTMEELVRRDPKGLYGRAARGEVDHFTGVSDPYEAPLAPEIHVRTDQQTVGASIDAVVRELGSRSLIV